ncbi:MAG: nucleotidyltransferase domain-containing protein [archaeon]
MDYKQINNNSLKIIEVLAEGKAYFSEIYEKAKIKSKNNLLKNLSLLTSSKILIKEENKSNTFYTINYSNSVLIALLSLINKTKFEKLPFNIKKSILECIFMIKPRISILFGSYAKGNFTKESDIDLLFVSDKANREKIKEISSRYGVKINLIFIEIQDFQSKDETIAHILKTGYPLTGEEYFYNEAKEI